MVSSGDPWMNGSDGDPGKDDGEYGDGDEAGGEEAVMVHTLPS